jgi:hypothetical protein
MPSGTCKVFVLTNINCHNSGHYPSSCLLFKTQLNSTLHVFPHLSGNKLRLRYEPKRLMLSIGLWWCYSYINITVTILGIIQCPVFYLKYSVSETGFCLRLQVKSTRLGPMDRASLSLRSVYIRLAMYFSYLSSLAYQTDRLYTYVFHWSKQLRFVSTPSFLFISLLLLTICFMTSHRFCVNTQVHRIAAWVSTKSTQRTSSCWLSLEIAVSTASNINDPN